MFHVLLLASVGMLAACHSEEVRFDMDTFDTFRPAFTPNFNWACAGMARQRQAISIKAEKIFFIISFV